MTNPSAAWRRAHRSSTQLLEALETRLYFAGSSGFTGGDQTRTRDVVAVVPVAKLRRPSTPSNFSAKVTGSSVNLAWRDTAANEAGLLVYRSTNGRTYTIVADLTPDSASWVDTSVDVKTKYWYKVCEYNSAGTSTTPARRITTNPALPLPPIPPTPPASVTPIAPAIIPTPIPAPAPIIPAPITTPAPTTPAIIPVLIPTPITPVVIPVPAPDLPDIALPPAPPPDPPKPVADPTPITPDIPPTTDPTPPPPPPPTIGGVTYSTANMTTFSELQIDGTSANDSIYVSQSNGLLIIIANQQTTTYAANFGDIKIYGASGDDNITVDSSVNIATLIYGGDGNDTIRALGSAKMTVVTIGNGTSTVTGNGINTAYWVNPGDTVNASASEIALGGVNQVDSFYQPFTKDSADPNYIARDLLGQNLPDPTDSGVTIRRPNSSFWGTGPTLNDINQGQIADCYYLADLSAMACTMPQTLMNMGVDLGDGTYAVRFVRKGVTSYVRVDGDLYASGAFPGAGGGQWVGLFEKAYAFFLRGSNTYASLNYGSPSAGLSDAGLDSTTISASGLSQTALQDLIDAELAAGKPIVAETVVSISAGAPLIGSHVYTVIGSYLDASGQLLVQLRNPWGFDSVGSDDNPADGIVTISYGALITNISALSYAV